MSLKQDFYHAGNIALQRQGHSEALAERLAANGRTEFTPGDKEYIEAAIYFFIATADAQGRPDCSYKGGPPGFVRVTGPSELAFPDYDGNGMYKSLGNIAVNAHVGLLFIAMHGRPRRLRVNGVARVNNDDPLMNEIVGAQAIVRVSAEAIFPNCPRYIPQLTLAEPSRFTPAAGRDPVEPEWKSFEDYKDLVPPRRPAWKG
jgi:uncharacterized protein